MRTVTAAVLVFLSAGAVVAQPGPLTPAPVPNVDSGQVAPADRAGVSNSSANQAPYSGVPNNMAPGGGREESHSIGSPDERSSPAVPDVSR